MRSLLMSLLLCVACQPRTESMDMLPPVRVLQEKQDPRFSITKPTKTKV